MSKTLKEILPDVKKQMVNLKEYSIIKNEI